ncbi:TRAP transporter substrate-binding protein [Leisingera daeponensis]|uniref:TRAP transporter substrate-binding protein n=1 Tax=Leisingera daeponensis TaxID=405746 RepID=UPI001C96BB10|nr:TRAP transporter substrate-binding protein [Leisingera daeponensis]MBY6059541.1 TRAP transporter substrate-binding protein [Leisingera daeponensis]
MKQHYVAALAGVAMLTLAPVAVSAEIQDLEINVLGSVSFLSSFKNYEEKFWNEHLLEASNGKVQAIARGFDEMGLKGGEVLRLTGQSVVDISTTVLGYTAADDPRNEAADLAGLAPTVESARAIADAYKPVLASYFADKYGVKVLATWPYPAQVFYCNTEISDLSDIAGKKVRTGNRTLSEFVSALGGTGVTMAFADVIPALQTGVVDCAITGTLSGNSANWYEVSSHLYALPVGWSTMVTTANLSFWNKLNPETQTFLQDEIGALENDIWIGAGRETQDGINCNVGADPCVTGTKADMTLVPVTDADRALLEKITRDVILPKWAERCSEDCVADFNETVGPVIGMTAEVN